MEDKPIKLTLDVEEPTLNEVKEDEVFYPEFEQKVNLTPEEQKTVDEFVKQIDLSNSNIVLQYGVGAQKKIASFSEKTLNSVKTKDLGEVGNLLSSVVTELKSFDETEDKGVFGFFKKGANKITALRTNYEKAEKNVDEISKILENHQITLMKDISLLDQMYKLNEQYFKELSMYILAGQKKLDQVRNEELPNMLKEAENSPNSITAQKANDLRDLATRFEKKLHDLELTRMVSLQMAPQIRMVQSSNAVMVEKIQSTIVNTIPIWKNQMVLSLGVYHNSQAAEAQKKVTDLTNDLLRKNADTLKMSTIETAKATERGIIDVETIRHTNEQLISALDEVRNIQIEGHENRLKAKQELMAMEQELKNRLLNKPN
ncbi:MAG: toxic anion resistance protein [Finegoldia magna]|uniref:toxic anion resistance protein n=1 Tax=Finegoldia magna TaxID=1260 RepID=UPI00288C3FF9|nr:toxic anion resistance protein [Finegoldia magna]MDU5368858.1 toxic anion resistance protein [Finegoldia magna]MDU5443761.1 toxic anion resistance protein [Finegoldia magna]